MMVKDQLGRMVHCPEWPQRIVSLVPSQTELLADLSLSKEVIGITKFCIHPQQWFKEKIKVGGTKHIHFETIDRISPDLIIANKEENKKEDIEWLEKKYNVWISDVNNLESALDMIHSVGLLTGKMQEAIMIENEIRKSFSEFANSEIIKKTARLNLNTAYLIWRNPYMAAGNNSFIHAMMNCCGLKNIFENRTRYPQTTLEELKSKNCQLLILSTEPYPFSESMIPSLRDKLPDTRIVIGDGEMFSWYGSRLKMATSYFQVLLKNITQ